MFFFPEPPEEPDFVEQLALRSSEIEQLDPSIRILLRQAYARQLSLMELNMDANPAETKVSVIFMPNLATHQQSWHNKPERTWT